MQRIIATFLIVLILMPMPHMGPVLAQEEATSSGVIPEILENAESSSSATSDAQLYDLSPLPEPTPPAMQDLLPPDTSAFVSTVGTASSSGFYLDPTGLFPSQQPSLVPTGTAEPSARIRRRPKIGLMRKRHFRSTESAVFQLSDAQMNVSITVLDARGNETSFPILRSWDGEVVTIRVLPHISISFRPGKYTLRVSDEFGISSEQDFYWGVLAVNTNKSIYTSGETAKLAFAVLNDTGMMVCDADLSLSITAPNGEEHTLSTRDGTIAVNQECFKHGYTEKPDYEAAYDVGGVGVYQMNLTAETTAGTYSIADRFEVRDSVPFDVERITATRIYPIEKYPVKLAITFNEDFSGEIREVVPESFEVVPPTEGAVFESVTIEPFAFDSEMYRINLRMPFDGSYHITLRFGEELKDPLLAASYSEFGLAGHDGVDFALPEGTPVLAADDGAVLFAGEGAYGTTIILQHSWGRSYYGHLNSLLTEVDQTIKKGMVLGLSGQTGLATAAHLHFGIKLTDHDTKNGYYGKTDPMPFLTKETEVSEYSVKVITWRVSAKKGDRVILSYQYDAPNVSPEFYLIGPLSFISLDDSQKVTLAREPQATGSADLFAFGAIATASAEVHATAAQENPSVVFSEARLWQIASDSPGPTVQDVTGQIAGAVNQVTVNSVPGGTNQLYIAVGHFYITAAQVPVGNNVISSISGGSLTWAAITGTRGESDRIIQPRVEMWWAYGSPAAFNLVANLAGTTELAGAHVAVARIDGASNEMPINGEYANTEGQNAQGDTTGTDNAAPTIVATVSNANSLILNSLHPRNSALVNITDDADYTREYGVENVSSGNASSIVIYSRSNPPTGTDTIAHTLPTAKPWVMSVIEIREVSPTTDQLLRLGKWFFNGIQKPFFL